MLVPSEDVLGMYSSFQVFEKSGCLSVCPHWKCLTLLDRIFALKGHCCAEFYVKQKDKLFFLKVFILKRQNIGEKPFCLGLLAWEVRVRERLCDLCLSYLILEPVVQVQEIANSLCSSRLWWKPVI